jgi:hypothetical protein
VGPTGAESESDWRTDTDTDSDDTSAQAPPLCALCHGVSPLSRPVRGVPLLSSPRSPPLLCLSFPVARASAAGRKRQQKTNRTQPRREGSGHKGHERKDMIAYYTLVPFVGSLRGWLPRSPAEAARNRCCCLFAPSPVSLVLSPPATPPPPATADANGHHTERERTFRQNARAHLSRAPLTGFLPCVVRIRRLPVLPPHPSRSLCAVANSQPLSHAVRPRRRSSTFPLCPSSRCR